MSCRRIVLAGLAITTLAIHTGRHAWGDEASRPAPTNAPGQTAKEPETLKERLSDKASDEQRVDNCKVAPERRGPAPRPDDCAHGDASAPAQTPQ